MNFDYRKKLLGILARIEQQIAKAERLIVKVPTNDEILLRTSKQLVDLRLMLSDVEWKLQIDRFQ